MRLKFKSQNRELKKKQLRINRSSNQTLGIWKF